jgi:hypothetical protein
MKTEFWGEHKRVYNCNCAEVMEAGILHFVYISVMNIHHVFIVRKYNLKKLWPQSARQLYRPSERRLSANLMPTFVDRGCRVVSMANLYGRILSFLDRKQT